MRMLSLTILLTALLVFPVYAGDDPEPVRIEVSGKFQIDQLSRLGINIENVRGNQVDASVTPEQLDMLEGLGFSVTSRADELREFEEYYRSILMDDLGEYHTYAEQTAILHNIAVANPSIALLDSFGPSVEGRWIWALKLTDNPHLDEDEPEFCYFATMHGDEPPGTEMCINLIQLLINGYDTSATFANIIDNCELWIVPLLNPDGYTHVPSPRRYNANGIDLNRNFPVPDGSIGDDGTYNLEPETEAIMGFCNEHHFVIAANYHTGALLTNYPWDYTYTRSPEDTLLIELSLAYSYHNPPMWNSTEFDYGITNGADWYIVRGSLQDWGHHVHKQLHLTIEINNIKWPSESALDGLWEDNRESMLALIAWVNRGVRGIVSDSLTGNPLGATVNVLSIDNPVYCDPAVGDYHRVLIPGTYTIQYSCPLYSPKTISGIVVGTGEATRVDVQLRPYGTTTITGIALLGDESNHSGIRVSADNGTLFYSDTTDAEGHYLITGIGPGAGYTVTASKNGWRDSSLTYEMIEGAWDTINFLLYPFDTIFFSDFEDDSGGFYSYGPKNDWEWGVPTTGPGNAYSGTKCWATQLNSNYRDSSRSHLALELDLSRTDQAYLTFQHWYAFQAYYFGYHDGGNIKVETREGTPILVYPADGYDLTLSEYNWLIPNEEAFGDNDRGNFWHTEDVDLTPFCGNEVTIYFEFGSSNQQTESGWYLDDVMVMSVNYTLIAGENYSGTIPSNIRLFKNYPNPFNSATRIHYKLAEPSCVEIFIRDLLGREVWHFGPQNMPNGDHYLVWDGKDLKENTLPNGMYFCDIKVDNARNSIKMLLVK
ncbi:hypothetical protein JW877_00335 [bacterium]|nr:hypothetical protein [bacterium]